MPAFGIVGTVVDALPDWSLRIQENCLLGVNVQGKIVFRGKATKENLFYLQDRFGFEQEIIYLRSQDEFLLPGFIDSHIHASQFTNCGLGLDVSLMQWLYKYTFPLEKSLSDPELARRVYNLAVGTTLSMGTTSAAYYATIQRQNAEILCDIAEEQGQRALVGKVCMNRNSPNDYQETTADALAETALFVAGTIARKSLLLAPVITPRFVPACDQELLMGLADIAANKGGEPLRIQTHLSESPEEVKLVKSLEPHMSSYTQVYNESGLLTNRSIMAHCIHLDETEMEMIKTTNAGVSHCPNSNCSLRSGTMNLARMKSYGIKVGLGTDCSGGYTPSMLNAMRFAIASANHISMAAKEEEHRPLDFKGAIYLATRGSAEVCSLNVGAFDVGLQFDALRIRMNTTKSHVSLFAHMSLEDMVQKFVFLGDDRNIVQVYVNGRLVKDI